MTEEERRRRFGRWQPEALIGGETAKAGLFGKALGLLGLDADGNRAATSWTDAAKHTAGNLINAPQDIGNQLLDLQDYQPVYGTGASNPEDRARAGQQAVSTFGLAGLAPLGGAAAGRMMRQPHAPAPAGPVLQDGVVGDPSALYQRYARREGITRGTLAAGDDLFPLAEGNYGADRWLERPPGQDRAATRMDGSALYSNSAEAAAPGMVVQGYRGYNPKHGIGPGEDRPQVVWATPDKGLADVFGRDAVTAPVEMRFKNPYVVDAKGSRFDNVPVREGRGLLSYLMPTMRHHIDDMAVEKQMAGHDGMIVKNVRETGKDNVAKTADQLVALKRGTVYDPASGDLLWSNPKEGAVPGLLAQAGEQKGITAYHGSPHDFDRFSLDKIGTGEGAQAYGHGLYFAENEGVAKSYRDALSRSANSTKYTVDGNPVSVADTVGFEAAKLAHANGGVDQALSALRKQRSSKPAVYYQALERKLSEMKEQGSSVTKPDDPGHMYEVKINADPEQFLDWDKPLSQQSERARAALDKAGLGKDMPDGLTQGKNGRWYLLRGDRAIGGDGVGSGFASQAEAKGMLDLFRKDYDTGTVGSLIKRADSNLSHENQLRDAGIPGIRYLDQGSRTAGEGSRNFVVFDENLISIVKKYGWAGAAAMYGLSTEELQAQAPADMKPQEKSDPYRSALQMQARRKVLGLPY